MLKVLAGLALIPFAIVGLICLAPLVVVAIGAGASTVSQSMDNLEHSSTPAPAVRTIEPAKAAPAPTKAIVPAIAKPGIVPVVSHPSFKTLTIRASYMDESIPRTPAMQSVAAFYTRLTGKTCDHLDIWDVAGPWLMTCNRNAEVGFLFTVEGDIADHGTFEDMVYRVYGQHADLLVEPGSNVLVLKFAPHMD